MKEWKKITYRGRKLAEETAARINADYPGTAKVEDECCYITADHYEYCKNYVLTHCAIVQTEHINKRVNKRDKETY